MTCDAYVQWMLHWNTIQMGITFGILGFVLGALLVLSCVGFVLHEPNSRPFFTPTPKDDVQPKGTTHIITGTGVYWD